MVPRKPTFVLLYLVISLIMNTLRLDGFDSFTCQNLTNNMCNILLLDIKNDKYIINLSSYLKHHGCILFLL